MIRNHEAIYLPPPQYPDERALPTLAWLIVGTLGQALAGLVVAGVLAGRLGAAISPALLGLGALLGASSLLPLARRRFQLDLPQLLLVALVGASVAGVGLGLAWPALLPLGRSVDAVHHLQLVDWLATEQRLPPLDARTRGLMGEMIAYPPGFHLVVVEAAAAAQIAPIQAIYPVAALLGGLAAALVAMIALAGGSERGLARVLAMAAVPLLLLAHRAHTVEAFIDHSYYAMVLGLVFVLLACGKVICEPHRSPAGALQLGLVLAGLLVTYPLWLPVPCMLLALWAAPVWRKRLHLVALALLPPLALAAIDLPARLATGQMVLEHQGVVTAPSLESLAPLLLAIPAALLLLWSGYHTKHMRLATDSLAPALFRWERAGVRVPNPSPTQLLVIALVIALAYGGALALAARIELAAPYHSLKLLFVALPLAVAVVAAGLLRLGRLRSPLLRRTALAACVLLLALSSARQLPAIRGEQLISTDLVRAAAWLRANDPAGAEQAVLTGAPAGQLGYWLQVGLLGQWRDEAQAAVRSFSAPAPTPESWAIDADMPPVAIAAVLDETPPGSEIAARFGQVAVLRRTQLDQQAINPLILRYDTFWDEGRIKTALELIRPLAGPLPQIELRLEQAGQLVNSFVLQPNSQRTKRQYLGADLVPETLGGVGYINAEAYPTFAAPNLPPTGELELHLRLNVSGVIVDTRPLASFTRGASGQISGLKTRSGELNYLRRSYDETALLPFEARFGNYAALTGWRELPQDTPGELAVLLRWQALAPPPLLGSELQLRDQSGALVAQSRALPQGG
ncbi:MAG: hypothetical protein H7Z42_10150, partial [Roseiflexaceae bacterium]|nr:hypothetical protein [Roseiflexaceae bacterium]